MQERTWEYVLIIRDFEKRRMKILAFGRKEIQERYPLLLRDLLSGGNSRQLSQGGGAPCLGLGVTAPSSCASGQSEGGSPGANGACPGRVLPPPPAAEAYPGLEPGASPRKKRRSCTGHLGKPAGVQVRLTHGSTSPSRPPPPALGSQRGPRSNPSRVDQPWGAPRAARHAGFRPHLAVPQSETGPSPRHLLRPAHASPGSSLPTLENYTLPLRRPRPGDVRRREGRAIGRGWGREKTVPAFLALHPPLRVGSRHVVPGAGGGEKRREFFGCSGLPVVPLVSAANSGDAALRPGAPAGGAAPRSREPGLGRCWRRRRHLRLLVAAAAASAAGARAPAASAATAAAARAASAAVAASDAPALSRFRGSGRMWVLGIAATFCGLFLLQGKKRKRLPAPPGAHTPIDPSAPSPPWHPPPGPCCAGVAQREFGGGFGCWCPEARRWKVSRRRGGSDGFVGLEMRRLGLQEKPSWGGRRVREALGPCPGRGGDKALGPTKLAGVSSNPWEWRRRQVTGALGSLGPGRAGAGWQRSGRTLCAAARKRGIPGSCVPGSWGR